LQVNTRIYQYQPLTGNNYRRSFHKGYYRDMLAQSARL